MQFDSTETDTGPASAALCSDPPGSHRTSIAAEESPEDPLHQNFSEAVVSEIRKH